jgi:HEAT repeat protein
MSIPQRHQKNTGYRMNISRIMGCAFFLAACSSPSDASKNLNPAPRAVQSSPGNNPLEASTKSGLVGELIRKNLKLLKSGQPTEKRIAAAKLGGLRAKEALAPLTRIVQRDSDPDMLRVSLSALGNIADFKSIAIIKEKLNHPHFGVQRSAIRALSKFADPHLAEVFIQLLKSPNPAVQHSTLKALRLSSEESFRSFRSQKLYHRAKAVMETKADNVNIEAAQVIARLAYPESTADLCALLKKEKSLELRIQATRLLGDSQSKSSADCLKSAYKKVEPRLFCVRLAALVRLGEKNLLPKLTTCLKNRDKQVRFTTVSELALIGGRKAKEMIEELISKENDFNLRRHSKRMLSRMD